MLPQTASDDLKPDVKTGRNRSKQPGALKGDDLVLQAADAVDFHDHTVAGVDALAISAGRAGDNPVSYTHLDVYKRQPFII